MTTRLHSRIKKLESKVPTGAVGGVLVDTSSGYRWNGREYRSADELPFAIEDFRGTHIYITDFAKDRLCSQCQQGYRANVGDTCPGCGKPLPLSRSESGRL